ncbi:outer membrane beta-barrel protein [Pseudoduganella umbonata]|uniref:Opacity protein-like surface antigen n=1 Tax=Pseudoduganella umbonata TaxID=864828 RepID=A0A4P8HRW6_9BURK|nr:outer membrane beta-barrel protein [Pseudoduganella umbonata]MBB3222357.1 opacity protein-like surface antigen [Pseudoduganella umbonata]QCP12573.1 porin family protein [Pseudoduganella umbonata]
MTPHRLAYAAAIFLAASAQAQIVEQPSSTYTGPGQSATQALFDKAYRPYPRAYGGNEAASPNDKAFAGLFKRDPRLVGGYELFPNLAIEAGYVYLLDRGFHPIEPGPDEAPGGLNTNNFSSHLAVKYTLPLTDRLSAFGKVGIAHSVRTRTGHQMALDAGYDGATPVRRQETDRGRYLGAGAQYKLSEKASIDAQYGRHGDAASTFGKATNATGARANLKIGF